MKRLATVMAGVATMMLGILVVPTPSFAASAQGTTGDCLSIAPPAGSTMPAPFLKLPFRERDARLSLYDTQGWLTSPDELAIDDEVNGDWHAANDLELVTTPDYGYGLPIVAAASGRAYFSYQYISGSWTDSAGKTHQVGWGAGLFVEVRHAKDEPGNAGWVTQYVHLSRIAPGIPYLPPTAVPDPNDSAHPDWRPTGILQDDDTLWNAGVPVRQGQVIGYMGDTGIGLDWKDNFDVTTGKVTPRNRVVLKPWDPPQLHFQLYQGRVNGTKQNIVDPFGLYAQVCPGEWHAFQPHQNPYGQVPGFMRAASSTAWVTDRFGRPEYAAP
jgi:hypothetical protein